MPETLKAAAEDRPSRSQWVNSGHDGVSWYLFPRQYEESHTEAACLIPPVQPPSRDRPWLLEEQAIRLRQLVLEVQNGLWFCWQASRFRELRVRLPAAVPLALVLKKGTPSGGCPGRAR